MANKKISIKSIILIVLGVVLVLPLFINFWNYNNKLFDNPTFKLFDKDMTNIVEEVEKGEFFFTLTKIATVVAIIAGLAVAVLEVLKILNINLAFIEKIAALVAAVAGIVVLVSAIIYFIISSAEIKDITGTKDFFFSAAIGWYFAWIPSIAIGALTLTGKKD